MKKILAELKAFPRKGDMVLLLLCLFTSAFGILIVASTTNAEKFSGNTSYIVIQTAATLLGVAAYAIISSIDAESLAERRRGLVLFNSFMLFLLIPFGVVRGGNKSWLDIPLVPVMIQAAEVCKITFIVIMASVMNAHQNRISRLYSLGHMALHLGLFGGLNMALSKDMGVTLIFVFITIAMAFAGGVSFLWFGLAIGGVAVAFPILWQFLEGYQRDRILVLFDPTIDPQGLDERWHAVRSLRSLTGGGLTGQGLFNGTRTQSGALYAQHTDYIFSSIGEELGFFGCALVIVLELAIVARCVYVGIKTPNYMRRLICFGAAAALIFQNIINMGMCIGVMPVIGITLPFISYGGSSIISLYAMLGLVSGVHARPDHLSHERYIQPPRNALQY